MTRIDVILDDELEKKFRQLVIERLGFKKGNMTMAIEEAIEDWMKKKYDKDSAAARKAWLTRRQNKKKKLNQS